MFSLFRRAGLLALIVSLILVQAPQDAASADKVLSRLAGTVGHKTDLKADLTPLSGDLVLKDSEFAVTLDKSQGLLTLPDSTQVTLGSNTTIQVGAFTLSDVEGNGSVIALNNGTLRFKVVRPAGGKSNYKFTTATSTTSVRGTVAAIASDPQQGDTIACLDCAPGDVVVTVLKDNRSFSLTTGQVLKISIAGLVAGAAIAAVASQFAGAGVSMSASSATGAAGAAGGGAGAGGAAGASGAAAGVSTAVVAGTVAVAAAAAVVSSNNKSAGPTPIPQQSGTITVGAPLAHVGQSVKPTPSPSPSASPSPKGVNR